jgi:hypothetical protein
LNCSIIDEGPCSDELETRLEQRANSKKLWKIQVKAIQGWADLKVNVDGTDEYVDDFCESEAEAQGECQALNRELGGGYRVVPSDTPSDFDLY